MKIFVFVACLFIASSAAAQERPAPSLRLPTTIYLSSAAADLTSTAYCLHHPLCHEANPTLRWAERPFGTAGVVAVSAAMDVAAVWAIHRYLGTRHPKIASVLLYAASADRSIAAVRNVRNRRSLNVTPSAVLPPTCATRTSGPFTFCQ